MSACSISTATAGSTSTRSKGVRFLPGRTARSRATGSFATAATAPLTMCRRGHESSRFPRGYGHGVAVGDFDNDGRPDLFVTRWRSYALYHNRGDGTFEDVTQAPVSGAIATGRRRRPSPISTTTATSTSTSATTWSGTPTTRRSARTRSGGITVCCDPAIDSPLPDHVFRNDGGRFVDVTAEAGIVDRDGRGLGVVAADLDGDGRIDLFVANDMTANFLFHNLGGFRFEEVGHSAGVAANADGRYQAGMGIACGDLDGDGRPDLAVTNFYGESTTFFHNLGHGLFADHTAAVGLAGTEPVSCSDSGSRFSTPTTTAGSTSSPPTATSATTRPIFP